MQITEKLRHDILFALPELSGKQVKKIARYAKVSEPTVWRNWRRLRSNEPIDVNPVILAIAELAAKKKIYVVHTNKKLVSIEKQLSAIT